MDQPEHMCEERMKDVLLGLFTGLHACLDALDTNTYRECANTAFARFEATTGWTKQEIADWQEARIQRKISSINEGWRQQDMFDPGDDA